MMRLLHRNVADSGHTETSKGCRMLCSRKRRTSQLARSSMLASRGQRFSTPWRTFTLEYICLVLMMRDAANSHVVRLLDGPDRAWCSRLVLPAMVHGYLRFRSSCHGYHLTFLARYRAAQEIHHPILCADNRDHRCWRCFLLIQAPDRTAGSCQLRRVDGLLGLVSHLVF